MTPIRRALVLAALMLASPLAAGGQPGAADYVTVVAPLTVVAGEAPAPLTGSGAPNYSPEQMASGICDAERRGGPRRTMEDGYAATVHARDVRLAAAKGLATPDEMVKAELERQKQIHRVAFANPWKPPAPRADLAIQGVTHSRLNENGREVLQIGLTVHNLTAERIELPPVTLISLDDTGYLLAAQTTPLNALFIEPHASLSLTVRFRNPPAYTRKVAAVFPPPFAARDTRACDFLDPIGGFSTGGYEMHPVTVRTGPPPAAIPQVGSGAPLYTPTELASLQDQVWRDARWAFQNQVMIPCEQPGKRRWRELMGVADTLEEAWVATAALQEVRRDAGRGVFLPDDVAAAELARQAKVRAMLDARQWRPTPRPQYAPLTLEPPKTSHRRDAFTIDGLVRHQGAIAMPVPPLRLSAVDRNGYVVGEALVYLGRTVAPGQAAGYHTTLSAPADLVAEVKADFAC